MRITKGEERPPTDGSAKQQPSPGSLPRFELLLMRTPGTADTNFNGGGIFKTQLFNRLLGCLKSPLIQTAQINAKTPNFCRQDNLNCQITARTFVQTVFCMS